MERSFAAGLQDDEAQAVLAAIDAEETIAFLRDLVRVPTVNPPGDIAAAVALCEPPLRDAGFAVRTLAHAPGKPNLVAEWGNPDGPTLAFNAHLDVVPVGDERAWPTVSAMSSPPPA